MARLKPFERDAIGFLLRHLGVGVIGSALFGGLILWSDLAGIRSLALAEEGGWLALCLLFFGLFVTFGSLAMGAAIMGLGRGED
ncbi:MAG: hypothetical protein OEU09_03410 [Rhodospirillales bacterium]|nr:hypothetical protein [Rhodospirillales bacterium]MDH3792779.1 hypothetical protein [Rhodospirillales bacterium]MDH3910318.1 hypothetical protein [Rhodospirillales bacterium]MDH3917954.1 hypothetical protein [Rhodospirillales bacterium]MDH3968553.1 hypothetical protein [Rhodospirillales bacterium]